MTAALVQRKLNCSVSMHALDIEGGINSFLAAIDLATRYISTTADDEQYILILSGGIHRIAVSATDPRLAFLFGDGAAAVLLGVSAEPHFLASYAYTNYSLFDAAGTRMMKMDGEVSENLYALGKHHLLYDLYQMGNWKETLDFALEAACVTRDRLLEESGLSMDQMDLVLVTENNLRIRDLTLEALHVPQDRTATLFAEYGNTMSAMLPLLLDSVFREGRVREKANIMLISHGEGASGGGLLYRA
jgi:3-oxoacyl-[acyl-carrier-protein] synthase-3